MPKVYRVMQMEDGMPRPGSSARCLGVRVPADIAPDRAGMVGPGQDGMSVAPSLMQLPAYRIPGRLRHLAPKAAGRNTDYVWSMGEGAFRTGAIGGSLMLQVTGPNHGVVCPDAAMDLETYVTALAATRPMWKVDET